MAKEKNIINRERHHATPKSAPLREKRQQQVLEFLKDGPKPRALIISMLAKGDCGSDVAIKLLYGMRDLGLVENANIPGKAGLWQLTEGDK